MPSILEGRHNTKKSTLKAIYKKFKQDWLKDIKDKGGKYPTIWDNFPKTVGYGMFHKVIFVVDGTEEQLRNLTNLFFGLMKFTIIPLYDIMTEKEVDDLPDDP